MVDVHIRLMDEDYALLKEWRDECSCYTFDRIIGHFIHKERIMRQSVKPVDKSTVDSQRIEVYASRSAD
jgi:hypothetical protein